MIVKETSFSNTEDETNNFNWGFLTSSFPEEKNFLSGVGVDYGVPTWCTLVLVVCKATCLGDPYFRRTLSRVVESRVPHYRRSLFLGRYRRRVLGPRVSARSRPAGRRRESCRLGDPLFPRGRPVLR